MAYEDQTTPNETLPALAKTKQKLPPSLSSVRLSVSLMASFIAAEP